MIMMFSSHVLLSLSLLISLVRSSSGQPNPYNGSGGTTVGQSGTGGNTTNQYVCPAECVDSINTLSQLLTTTVATQSTLSTRITNAEGDIAALQTDAQGLDARLDALEEDKCKLLFSAKSGTGENVLQTWQAAASVGTGPGDDIFKSPEVERWGTRGVDLVRIKVLDAGVQRAFFLFDGRGSNKNNFMSKERLMASSSGGLDGQPFKYFDVIGHTAIGRHFFIQKSYNQCPNDFGWLVVVDGSTTADCTWESRQTTPYFIYCDTEAACNENTAPIGDQFTICATFID